MQPDDRCQIDFRQDVAIEDDHRLGQLVARILHRSAGPERGRLDDIADLDAETLTVPENLLDSPRLVVKAQDDLVNFRDLLEEVDLIVEKWPVEYRDNRLGGMDGEGAEPRAFAPGQKD